MVVLEELNYTSLVLKLVNLEAAVSHVAGRISNEVSPADLAIVFVVLKVIQIDCPQNTGPIRSGANNSEPKGSWRWPTDQNGPDSPRRERKTSPHRRDLPPRDHDRDRRDYRREDRKEDGHFDNRDNRYDGRRSSRFDDRREREYDRDNRSRRVYSPPPARGDRRRSRERSPDDRKRRRVD